MKSYIVCWGFAGCILLAVWVCCVLNAPAAAPHLLSIYLVTDKSFPPFKRGPMPKLGDLKLMSSPVIADADFVSFDLTNQTFAITPGAAKRLSKMIWKVHFSDRLGWEEDTPILPTGDYELIPTSAPFVLKVSGTPIYVGVFESPFSSSFFAVPTIHPETVEDAFISTNLTPNVKLRIRSFDSGLYPNGTDERSDGRIKFAVQKLFEHQKH